MAVSINEWGNYNYLNLKNAAIKISGEHQLSEDLLHYALEQMLYKDNIQSIIDSGGGNFYCIRIMLNAFHSSTSGFYRIYRRKWGEVYTDPVYEDEIDEDYEKRFQDKIEKLEEKIEKLWWYDRELFKIYVYEDHTISSLSRETLIPRTSVSLTINRVKKYLKGE